MIPALKDVPYPERLTKLRLPSLYYRRARGDMIQAYKHMTGLYKVNARYMCDILCIYGFPPYRGVSAAFWTTLRCETSTLP